MMVRLISQWHKHIHKTPSNFQRRCLSFVIKQLPLHPPKCDKAEAFSPNSCLNLLGLCKNLPSFKKIHSLLIVDGLANDRLCGTKLVSMYGEFGHLGCARLVFDRMSSPDFYAWKVMLRCYFSHGLHSEVLRFHNRMRICFRENDNFVFSAVLKSCSKLRDVGEGRKVHCQIVKVGSPDSFVVNGLVDMYAKCGEVECSQGVFEENQDDSVVSWTSMITGYVQNGCAQEGLILFNRMREGLIQGNEFTLGSLITACTKLGALHQGKWIHGYLIKSGIQLNSHLVTSLLDMYAKCGVIRDARSVFEEQCSFDLVSWTAMIVGYTQSGFPIEALELFTDKRRVGTFPNNITIPSVLSACAQLGNLNLGRSIHCLGLKLGLGEASFANALLDMYAKCHMIGEACCLFETAVDKDVVTWSSMICAYSQNASPHKALEFFHQMRTESVRPDAFSLVGVFSACALLGSLQVGSSLHAYSIKEGLLSSNIQVGTALLTLYAKCGDARSARLVFDSMEDKNIVTWGAMIGGYGKQGDGSGSLALFCDMLKEELKPNEAIFTNILSACSHTGMVGEGWKLFLSMCQDYKFVPSMKHYACMVDLLARAGRLEEAWEFITKMPFQPSFGLFGAFLHGCGLHSRYDLGEAAIRRMLQLNPDEACYYVLICNLYASDGRWSQVRQVREFMQQRGLIKSPGCSLTEMDVAYKVSSPGVAYYA